ncbi:complement C1q-like protein 4 isoform X2 [Sparus aurata]|uniref:complement C1q-like protein 4 isoform X2 n=1 Tax=Sparus aurata TaxID=8175 RepID=UPI0011C16D75|nr:complement C1q-like protein 4 isoform X2 [Sparus aurata]
MSPIKICSAFVIVTVLCVTRLVVAGPLDMISRQTAARQQGGAVLFFASYQGILREIEYNPIIFNEVLVNQGSAYSNDTGVFTAPVAGIYQFVFTAQLCRGNHNNLWHFMVKGDQRMVSGGDTTLNTCYLMDELKKGDPVWMKQIVGSCAWASTISKTITFSGVLLASEGVSTLGGKYGSGSSCPLPSLGHTKSIVSVSAGQSATLSTVAIAMLLCLLLLD